MTNNAGDGVYGTGSSSSIDFDDGTLSDNGSGLELNATLQQVVANNDVEGNTDYGVKVNGPEGSIVFVTNNLISGSNYDLAVEGTSTTVYVQENTIADATTDGIYVGADANVSANFNRILDGAVVESDATQTLDFTNNWWASNSGPGGGQVTGTGTVTTTPYLVLTATASTNYTVSDAPDTITASLGYNNYGWNPSSSSEHFPDGVTVSYSTTGGTVSPTSGTTSSPGYPYAYNTTTLTTGDPGTDVVTATVDGVSVDVDVTVTQAYTTTSLTSSENPAVYGDDITFTATVAAQSPSTGTPTGSVEFWDASTSTVLGTETLSGGVATLSTSGLSVGGHYIYAYYEGSTDYSTSSDKIYQLVGTPTTTTLASSVNPSVYGQTVTFTATVTGTDDTPTGYVYFYDGASYIGSGYLVYSGGYDTATLNYSGLAVGDHPSITAQYQGDGDDNPSTSSPVDQVVDQDDTTTSLSSSSNPSVYGQDVTFTATVSASSPGSGTPTGTVEFWDGATELGSSYLYWGTATYSTSTLALGGHTIQAIYDGDTNFISSSSSYLTQTVDQDGTSTVLTSSANPAVISTSVTFTATVLANSPGSGTPTGTVEFWDGATELGTGILSAGLATYSTSSLTLGNHTIQAIYDGDTNYIGSNSPTLIEQIDEPDTITLSSSSNPSTYLSSVTFTATVSSGYGTPTGTVEFWDANYELGTGTLSSGVATFTTSSLAIGGHTIQAVYEGDGTYIPNTSSTLVQTVNGSPVAWQQTDDPLNSFSIGIAETTVTPGTGVLSVSEPLSFDAGNGWLGQAPALVYNSGTVDVMPIIQVTLATNPGEGVPSDIEVQLIFDGVTQGWQYFSTYGHTAGDTYQLAVQASTAVTASGLYDWQVNVEEDYSSYPSITASATGTAVADVQTASPFGAGWGIAGVDQLLNTGSGMLWLYGDGDSAYFPSSGGGYTSPSGNFGTLVQNLDGSYTYTAVDQTQYNFTVSNESADLFELTSIVDPHSLTQTYAYNSSDELTQVVTPDGSTTNLSYSSGSVQIVEPGGRTVGLALDGSNNLTQITDAAGFTRGLSYDYLNQLTGDQWAPYSSYVYYSPDGLVSYVDGWTINPAAGQGLAYYPPDAGANGLIGTVVNPLGNSTTYGFDPFDRESYQADALGDTQVWNLDASGMPTQYIDQLGNTTQYSYDNYGDVTQMVDPDGGTTDSTYSNSHLTSEGVEVSAGDDDTSDDDYDAQGDLTETVDADGNTTLYGYDSSGNATMMVDAKGNTTLMYYDSYDRLTKTVDPDNDTTYTSYDAAGNPTETIDADGNTSFASFDGDGNNLENVNADGNTTSADYDAAGFATESVSAKGGAAYSYYDTAGNLTESVDADGYSTQYLYAGQVEQTETIDADGDPSYTGYDVAGRMTSTTDAYFNTTLYKLDADGNATQVISPNGGTTANSYNADGDATKTVDALGDTTLSSYDLANEATKTVDANGGTTLTEYDPDGNVTKTVDPLGETTLTSYDADGNVTASEDAMGNVTYNYFDPADRNTLSVDADGYSTITSYDPDGNVTKTVDGDGGTTLTFYDPAGLTTKTVDADGNTSLASYDADGNATKTVDADGGTTLSSYDSDDRMTSSVAPNGITTLTTYDGDGNATETMQGSGTVWTSMCTDYDEDGRVTATEDADGDFTYSQYNSDGDLTASSNANGNYTYYQFNADDQQTAMVDARGYTSYSYYDADGNVTKTVDADGYSTLSFYNLDGEETASVDANGNTSYTSYNADGEATMNVDPLGNTTLTSYDDDGNVTQATDANGNETLTTYNALGQVLTTEVLPSGSTVALDYTQNEYDKNGNLTETINGVNDTTFYTYDGDGNQTEQVQGYGTAAAETTQYGYDGDGNQTSVVDADGNTTTFVFNNQGENTEVIAPDGTSGASVTYGTTYQQYDNDGRMTESIDADGRTDQMQYDNDGNLTAEQWYDSGGSLDGSEYFSYDADGDMTAAGNDNGYYSMSYDADDRITAVSEPFGVSLNFAYDGDGNRTLVTDSFGGTEVSSYNADNELTGITYSGESQNLTANFGYDDDGEVTSEIMYAGATYVATSNTSYDAVGNVTNIHDVTAASTTVNFDYAYDVASELTQEIDNSSATTLYSYDATGQLTGAGSTSYAYDANGNGDNAGDTVGVDNRLLSDGTYNYTYDNVGNEITKTDIATSDTWTYTYNNDNELISAVETNSSSQIENSVTYEYDAFGNKIEATTVVYSTPGDAATATTSITQYAIDQWNPGNESGAGSVWADLNASSGLQTRYIGTNNVNQLVARIDVSGTVGTAYWYLEDRQNSTRDIITNSASLVDTIDYDAYGNIISETDSLYGGDYKYTGEQFDAVTGLQYNNARWYDPNTGRWTSQDPMGFAAGDSNLYRYVNNSPMDGADPSGEFAKAIDSQPWEAVAFQEKKQEKPQGQDTTISVALDRTVDASKGISGYSFDVIVGIKSKTKVADLEIRQLAKSSMMLQDWDGTALTRGQILEAYKKSDPAVIDSDGKWMVDTKWDWESLKAFQVEKNEFEASVGDTQSLKVGTKSVVAMINNKKANLDVAKRASVTIVYKIEIRNKAAKDTIIATHEWGYSWNNFDADWSLDPNNPAPKELSGTVRAGLGRSGFLNVKGFTGIPEKWIITPKKSKD